MIPWKRTFCAAALVLTAAACSNNTSPEADMAFGAAAPAAREAAANRGGGEAAAFLAYEHDATVTLPAQQIEPRLRQARDACSGGQFGDCVVLTVRQQGGDRPSATLGVRIVPAGVEPMIALASAGAELGRRSTRAEDLAVVVRDNTLAQERLRKERERLQQFESRRDLAVADMIALSRQLAETEARLEAAEQEGAQHRRRIDTQLLTIEFRPTPSQASRSEIALAIRDSGEVLAAGVAWTIRAVAFLLPVLALLAAVIAVIRRLRRRRAR